MGPGKIEALIFDLDGVVIDSEIVYLRLLHQSLMEHGCEIPEEAVYFMAGGSGRGIYDDLAGRLGGGVTGQEIMDRFYAACRAARLDYRAILDEGIFQVAEFCDRQGIKTALVSNSERRTIETVFAQCGLERCFSVVVSAAEIARPKPDPASYVIAMERLGVGPAACAVVEDSPYGIEAALGAGCMVIAREERRFHVDQTKAHCTITSLSDIIEIITDRNGKKP